MTQRHRPFVVLSIGLGLIVTSLTAQETGVTFERLLNAVDEPENWLTYSGSYLSQRHTALDEITTTNTGDLELKWVFQAQSLQMFETTPDCR